MKSQIKKIKTLPFILAVLVSLTFYGQHDNKEKSMFVPIYNLQGQKIIKGKVSSVSDTLLQIRHNSGIINISLKEIEMIKTKRSEGHN